MRDSAGDRQKPANLRHSTAHSACLQAAIRYEVCMSRNAKSRANDLSRYHFRFRNHALTIVHNSERHHTRDKRMILFADARSDWVR